MENFVKFSYSKLQSINSWCIEDISHEPIESITTIMTDDVNDTEGYKEIEYPVRREFLKKVSSIDQHHKGRLNSYYYGFDNPRVDFSSFLSTPHLVSARLFNIISVTNDQLVEFEITTCGRVCLWINDGLEIDYSPYTRNHGSKISCKFRLKAGDNKVSVYMDDLAERDVNFFFELKLLSDITLDVLTPVSVKDKEILDAIEYIQSIYMEKDYFEEGDIIAFCDKKTQKRLVLKHDTEIFKDLAGGNITDFGKSDQILLPENGRICLGHTSSFKSAGMSAVNLGIRLSNHQYLLKKFVFTVKNKDLNQLITGYTLAERKRKALKIFSELPLTDVNSAIAGLELGCSFSDVKEKLQPAFEMITNKGDCADFMFAPLISYTYYNREKLESDFLDWIEKLAIDFRYWIDEPGNDVMWYFSENHALLFHTCQYFAGLLFPEKRFSVSGRLGKEQASLGRKRLLQWFENFEKVGFSEWNSATYLPIDLIGFFSLYNWAPDVEVNECAKKALDFTFLILSLSHHGTSISNTFGRTYEHDLKGMKSGEISNIYQLAWECGNFNFALRASTLFCLSGYMPPHSLLDNLFLEPEEALLTSYLQGVNRVQTYLYKTIDYSLAGAINYQVEKKGHQQHYMNVSLGRTGTQMWINNPGELTHSGEGRPSYWAGNGICPEINQILNIQRIRYNLVNADYPFIHMYLPFWELDEIVEIGKWIFVRKGESFLACHFSNGFRISDSGDTRRREVISEGITHELILKCSSASEIESFNKFIEYHIGLEMDSAEFTDFQLGQLPSSNWNSEDRVSFNILAVKSSKAEMRDSYEVVI